MLLTAVYMENAADIANQLMVENDPDIIADVLDTLAQGGELTHAVIYRLLCKLRGWPEEGGVEITSHKPTAGDLILPQPRRSN
jgi:hypothetical protein